MKFYISLILFIIVPLISFSQSSFKNESAQADSSSIRPSQITDKFKLIDNNFKYDNFTFNSNWKDLASYFDAKSETELQSLPYKDLFKDNFYIFQKNVNTPIENIKFDHVFLYLSKAHFLNTSELKFLKKFDNAEDAVDFFINTSKIYFKINDDEYLHFYYGFSKNISITISLDGNEVELNIYNNISKTYENSMLFSFDYYYTSNKFKEIDLSNSFRGLKFGSTLESIKLVTKLFKTTSDYEFYTLGSKFLSWNSLNFDADGTHFGFTKDKKLATVILKCEISDEDSYNSLLSKLIEILGSETYRDDYIIWPGNNLTIYFDRYDSNNSDKKYLIQIDSNKFKSFIEKDY